jgi:hypothetical protein
VTISYKRDSLGLCPGRERSNGGFVQMMPSFLLMNQADFLKSSLPFNNIEKGMAGRYDYGGYLNVNIFNHVFMGNTIRETLIFAFENP